MDPPSTLSLSLSLPPHLQSLRDEWLLPKLEARRLNHFALDYEETVMQLQIMTPLMLAEHLNGSGSGNNLNSSSLNNLNSLNISDQDSRPLFPTQESAEQFIEQVLINTGRSHLLALPSEAQSDSQSPETYQQSQEHNLKLWLIPKSSGVRNKRGILEAVASGGQGWMSGSGISDLNYNNSSIVQQQTLWLNQSPGPQAAAQQLNDSNQESNRQQIQPSDSQSPSILSLSTSPNASIFNSYLGVLQDAIDLYQSGRIHIVHNRRDGNQLVRDKEQKQRLSILVHANSNDGYKHFLAENSFTETEKEKQRKQRGGAVDIVICCSEKPMNEMLIEQQQQQQQYDQNHNDNQYQQQYEDHKFTGVFEVLPRNTFVSIVGGQSQSQKTQQSSQYTKPIFYNAKKKVYLFHWSPIRSIQSSKSGMQKCWLVASQPYLDLDNQQKQQTSIYLRSIEHGNSGKGHENPALVESWQVVPDVELEQKLVKKLKSQQQSQQSKQSQASAMLMIQNDNQMQNHKDKDKEINLTLIKKRRLIAGAITVSEIFSEDWVLFSSTTGSHEAISRALHVSGMGYSRSLLNQSDRVQDSDNSTLFEESDLDNNNIMSNDHQRYNNQNTTQQQLQYRGYPSFSRPELFGELHQLTRLWQNAQNSSILTIQNVRASLGAWEEIKEVRRKDLLDSGASGRRKRMNDINNMLNPDKLIMCNKHMLDNSEKSNGDDGNDDDDDSDSQDESDLKESESDSDSEEDDDSSDHNIKTVTNKTPTSTMAPPAPPMKKIKK